MGLRSALRLVDAIPDTAAGRLRPWVAAPPSWGDGSQLEQLVWTELFDTAQLPASRLTAMSIPALARGRNILCPTIARVPLRALRLDTPVDPQPAWLTRTDGPVSPFHRMLWTVDDQLFYGAALWRCERGADTFPLRCWHVPFESWSIDPADQTILIGDQPAPARGVIYLPGPHEGILNFGSAPIRGAATLEATAVDVSERPFRVELHQTTDEPMTDPEIADLVAAARKALATNDGILFTNAAIQAIVHGYDSSQLVVEGRNANDVNMARLVGLPATLIDANTAGSSLTYETSAGRNAQAVDYGFSAYMTAITARLSMDDVVPGGQHVAFDLADLTGLTQSPTGPTLED